MRKSSGLTVGRQLREDCPLRTLAASVMIISYVSPVVAVETARQRAADAAKTHTFVNWLLTDKFWPAMLDLASWANQIYAKTSGWTLIWLGLAVMMTGCLLPIYLGKESGSLSVEEGNRKLRILGSPLYLVISTGALMVIAGSYLVVSGHDNPR